MKVLFLSLALFATATQAAQTYTTKEINLSKSDITCLAKNVYHEARGQHDHAMIGVAQVTLNRALESKTTVCKTVYARNQFTWTKRKKLVQPTGDDWADTLDVVHQFIKGKRVKGLETALFFKSGHAKVKQVILKIDGLKFHRV